MKIRFRLMMPGTIAVTPGMNKFLIFYKVRRFVTSTVVQIITFDVCIGQFTSVVATLVDTLQIAGLQGKLKICFFINTRSNMTTKTKCVTHGIVHRFVNCRAQC